jgi:hypothetical protein
VTPEIQALDMKQRLPAERGKFRVAGQRTSPGALPRIDKRPPLLSAQVGFNPAVLSWLAGSPWRRDPRYQPSFATVWLDEAIGARYTDRRRLRLVSAFLRLARYSSAVMPPPRSSRPRRTWQAGPGQEGVWGLGHPPMIFWMRLKIAASFSCSPRN